MMGSRTSFVSVGLFVCWHTHLQNVMLVHVVGSIEVASQGTHGATRQREGEARQGNAMRGERPQWQQPQHSGAELEFIGIDKDA